MYAPPPPRPGNRKLAYILIPVVGILICCIGGIAAVANGGKQGSNPTPTTVVHRDPTATPTATPTPTPSGPHPVQDATFGGREDDFIVKYGQPVFSNKLVRHYQFTAPDGSQAIVHIQLFDTSSSDGKQHAFVLTVKPKTDTWSERSATEAYKLFLPRDAQFVEDRVVPGLDGTTHIYLSPNLGATFAADQFIGTPGTFWVDCTTVQNGGCVFMLGDPGK